MKMCPTALGMLCDHAEIADGTQIRRAVIMRWAEGRCYAEIACELNVEEVTVRSMLSRAKPRLRKVGIAAERQQLVELAAAVIADWQDDGDPEMLAIREYAVQLLAAARGPMPTSLAAPEYDENGRRVGGRSPIVNADDLIRVILAKLEQKARERDEWQSVPTMHARQKIFFG